MPSKIEPGAEHVPANPTLLAAARGSWLNLILGVAILVAVLGIVLGTYWPALSAGAQYMDDKFYIGNPVIQHPSWALVRRIFGEVWSPSLVNGYYQPLSLLSYLLDFLNPSASTSLMPFHRTTLLLHLLNVALVVILLATLFGNWIVANLLGLIYGLHPLNADAVLWVAERKTVLSTCFALLSLLLYLAYVRHAERTGRGDWKRYSGSLLLYAFALLSKPTALPVVVLLPVLDLWPLKRFNRHTLLEKLPFVLLCGVAAVVAVISQSRAGDAGIVEFMKPHYLALIAAYSAGLYLIKVVYPTGLVSDYPVPQPFALTNMEVLGSMLLAVGAAAAILLSLRRTRAWLTGGLWFLFTILPTLGIIRFTSSVATNRAMYLPMIGLLLPLQWELGRLWNRGVGALKVSRVRPMVVALAAILAAGSAWATRSYESQWRDTLTFLRYSLKLQPNDYKLHTRMGNEWIERREYRAAIAEFRSAIALNPRWTENHLNVGRALFTVGEYGEAREAFAVALQQAPKDWRAHMLMGNTLERQLDLPGSLEEFRTAARLAPSMAVARFNVGRLLAQLGKLDEAAAEYRETLRLEPRFVEARRALEAMAPSAAYQK
jgi:Tfp pilus assembly protein PilF